MMFLKQNINSVEVHGYRVMSLHIHYVVVGMVVTITSKQSKGYDHHPLTVLSESFWQVCMQFASYKSYKISLRTLWFLKDIIVNSRNMHVGSGSKDHITLLPDLYIP